MPITPTEKIWMDGELVDWDKATVHVLTHSLHYGMGVFEGIRAYATANGPAIFRLREHTKRLFKGARILQMDLPFSEEEMFQAIKLTVRANGLDSCYIRPIAYLGYGEMGLNPTPCKVQVSIAVWSWGAYLGDEGIENGIRLKISSWARHDPRAMPTAAKSTGMYINSSLAKVEAMSAGYDEALMCTTSGLISEGTGENVFVVRDGQLFTPPASSVGALEGITSDSVVTIARDLGYSVTEREMRRTDLYMADEAFLTGTAAEVVPIASVDDRPVGTGEPGPITRAIQSTFFATVRGEVDQYKDWLEYVT
jgi:branched-chain amino acid aminotransferase